MSRRRRTHRCGWSSRASDARSARRLTRRTRPSPPRCGAMVETLSPTSLIGVRDRALLLVGFAGAFRRSEVVSLDVADVTFGGDGLVVQLRRSKTDQEGEGRKVGLPFGSNPLTCPVRSLRAWLTAAAITGGPIFRPVDRHANIAVTRLTDQSVALVVKRCAKAAGLDWA